MRRSRHELFATPRDDGATPGSAGSSGSAAGGASSASRGSAAGGASSASSGSAASGVGAGSSGSADGGAGSDAGTLLAQDEFQSGTSQWSAELETGGTVAAAAGVLNIDVPAGATVWFKQSLHSISLF